MNQGLMPGCPPQRFSQTLTQPASWYPAARLLQRKITAHVGPPNSGALLNHVWQMQVAKVVWVAFVRTSASLRS